MNSSWTRDEKTIAMAASLKRAIRTRQRAEKRERELKEIFRARLGLQDAELRAGPNRVVSKLCSRMILDSDLLTVALGDLSNYEKKSEYTEISVETI